MSVPTPLPTRRRRLLAVGTTVTALALVAPLVTPATATAAPVTTWAAATLTLTASSLGPVQVGMTVAQATTAAGVPVEDDAPACRIVSTRGTATHRAFTYDQAGRVTSVVSGSPFRDRTLAGSSRGSTGDDVLRASGSATRSYTDLYGSFVVLVRRGSGHELRFDAYAGRSGPVSKVQAGLAAVVEQDELCG